MKVQNKASQGHQTSFNSVKPKRADSNLLTISNASRYTLLLQTLIAATVVSIIRFILTRYTAFQGYVTVGDLGLMYTGLFFITGILFGMVNTDLKQAQKMPSQMSCNLQQLQDFFTTLVSSAKSIAPGTHPLTEAYMRIMRVALYWKHSLQSQYSKIIDMLEELSALVLLANTVDKSGGSIVLNILNIVDKIRRLGERSTVLSRVSVLPGAHGLAQFFVLASTVMLFFVKYTNQPTQLLIMICVYTVTWFIVRIINYIDDPFEDEMFLGWQCLLGSNRLIHVFIVQEYILRVLQKRGYLDRNLQVIPNTEASKFLSESQSRVLMEKENYSNLAVGLFNMLNQAKIQKK